ncbi:hypothetical protein EV426DRAFT_721263 [Tirmania nivea]|nr:hypothetical protein EV426DRAFT_721263 [Tirmania nivea]
MHFTLKTIFAATALLPLLANAHVHISNMPGVYLSSDNMPPVEASGANFPCAVNNFDRKNGEGPTILPGRGGKIQLMGTAVHSGGSCQISITYDSPPNKNSNWRVIKSFEGGCPLNHNGNLDASLGANHKLPPLDYTMPKGMPSGAATIAWTWVNNTGNREFYMRCQAVKIGGKKKNKRVFDKLPPMFVANIASENKCTTAAAAGKNIIFPNPGKTKVGNGNAKPNGNDCYTGAERRRIRG